MSAVFPWGKYPTKEGECQSKRKMIQGETSHQHSWLFHLHTYRKKLRDKWPRAIYNSIICENQTGVWEVASASFQSPTVVKNVIQFLQCTGPNSSSGIKEEQTDTLKSLTLYLDLPHWLYSTVLSYIDNTWLALCNLGAQKWWISRWWKSLLVFRCLGRMHLLGAKNSHNT